MNHYVADTHALFWYLIGSPRLGTKAKEAFDEGARGEALIYLPAIALAELYFLNEKIGRPLDFSDGIQKLRDSAQFIFVPFTAEDTLEFDMDAAVPEMHDRMIIGVARRLGAICITQDSHIAASGLAIALWS